MLGNLFSSVHRDPAECLIELDGAPITEFYQALVSVEVVLDRHRFSEATLEFETRRLEDGSWAVQDDERFQPWIPIKIEAAFGDEREEVMRGYVRQVKADYPAQRGGAKVTVMCQDESLKLDREFKDTHWGEETPITDGAIASQIAADNDLGLLAPPGEGQTLIDVNQNMTDMRFLEQRARENQYELIFRTGQLYFGPMQLDQDTQPSILVYAGPDTSCQSFAVDDDGHQPDQVAYEVAAEVGSAAESETFGPDQRILGTRGADSTGAGLNPFVWRPQRLGISDAGRMGVIARQMANEQAMRIKVDGELDGGRYGHVLLPGAPVGVDGAGERYSGTWYVDAVTHRFDVNGYSQRFKLLRNGYGDDLDPAAGLLAGVL